MKKFSVFTSVLLITLVAYAALPQRFKSGVIFEDQTASRAIYVDSNKQLQSSAVTDTELGYLSGATSALQTQIDAKIDDFTGSTDNVLLRSDGAGGNAVQESGIVVDDADSLTGLVNATLTGLLTSVGLTTTDPVTLSHESTPSTPGAGTVKVYAKNDDTLYVLNSAGTETAIGAGGGAGSGAFVNLAAEQSLNWSAESGDTTSFSESGGGTLAIEGSTVFQGVNSISYDASAASDYLAFGEVTITSLDNNNCIASFWYTGFDENITAQVYDGAGTAISNSQVLQARTEWHREENVTFICSDAADNEVELRLTASADAAIGYVDNIWVGENYNVIDVSQASFVGSIEWPLNASCLWTRSTSGSFANFADDTGCASPTVSGRLSDSSSGDRPEFTITNAGIGEYVVVMEGDIGVYSSAAGTATGQAASFQLHDGTNAISSIQNYHSYGAVFSSSLGAQVGSAHFTFNLTAPDSSLTINLQGKRSLNSGIAYVDARYSDVKFSVYHYPLSSDTAFKADQAVKSWSGNHAQTCLWANTGSGLDNPTADATCTLVEATNTNFGTVVTYDSGGSALPGITFDVAQPSDAYFICVNASVYGSTTSTTTLSLTDGTTEIASNQAGFAASGIRKPTTLCAKYEPGSSGSKTLRLETATSAGTVTLGTALSPSIHWTIFKIQHGMSAPLIKNSVVTSSDSVWGHESAVIDYSGTTPSVTTESGDWIASIAANSTGDSTITINSGIFSSAPICVCSGQSTATDTCVIDTNTAVSATTVRVQIVNPPGTAADRGYNIHCHGPR